MTSANYFILPALLILLFFSSPELKAQGAPPFPFPGKGNGPGNGQPGLPIDQGAVYLLIAGACSGCFYFSKRRF